MLREHCAAIGRDPAEIESSIQALVDPENIVETRERVQSYIDAGATHIILSLRAPYPDGIVRRIADEIATPLLEEYGQPVS